jgi:hypothetical protein
MDGYLPLPIRKMLQLLGVTRERTLQAESKLAC